MMINFSISVVMVTVIGSIIYILLKRQLSSAVEGDDIERDGDQKTKIRHGQL